MAALWGVYDAYRTQGKHRYSPAHEVAVKEALLKISRIAVGAFREDNYVDAAAYLAIAYECETRSGSVPS